MKTFYNNLIPPTAGRRKGCKSLLRLLTLFVMCLVTGGTMADTFEFDVTRQLKKDLTTLVQNYSANGIGNNDVNIKFSKASTEGSSNYADDIKIASNSTIKITPSSNVTITNIVFTALNVKNTINGFDTDETTKTYTLNTTSGNITTATEYSVGKSSVQITKIEITYTKQSEGPTITISAPTPVKVNTNFTFTATPSNYTTAPTSYTWYEKTAEDNPIEGITGNTYTGNKNVAGKYDYYCKAIIDGKEVTSNTESVDVEFYTLALTATDVSLDMNGTKTATATVTAKDTETKEEITGLTYEYAVENTKVATVEDGTITAVAAGETTVNVIFSGNDKYSNASTTFTVKVADTSAKDYSTYTTMNISPAEKTANPGGAVKFAMDDIGGSNKTFTWFVSRENKYSGERIDGATKREYSFNAPSTPGTYYYYCEGHNNKTPGNYISKIGKLTVTEGGSVKITTAVEPLTKTSIGKIVALTIATDGTKPKYQWYSNTTASNEGGTAITGATKQTYSFTTTEAGTFYYYCVVTCTEGTVTSGVATVNVSSIILPVLDAPRFTVQVGKTHKLNVVASANGADVASELTFTYTSDNEAIATVDANGVVTGVKAGTTNIRFTSAAVEGKYEEASGEAILTVMAADAYIPVVKYTATPGTGDNVEAPKTEDEAYKGNSLTITLEPEEELTSGSYEIYYTIDGSNPTSSTTATKYDDTKKIKLTQTTFLKAAIKIISGTNKGKWSEILERTYRFNFTLIKTLSNGQQIEPGVGYDISENGKTYIITTYGSLGDTEGLDSGKSKLWDAGEKDPEMNNSYISGFDYHAIGNKDAGGETITGTKTVSGKEINTYAKYEGGNEDNTTFDIPINGAYMKFEPKMDGQINMIVRQNGIIGGKTPNFNEVRRRYAHVCDETGKAISQEEGFKALISTNSIINSEVFWFGKNNSGKFGVNGDKTYTDAERADFSTTFASYQETLFNSIPVDNRPADFTGTTAADFWKYCQERYRPSQTKEKEKSYVRNVLSYDNDARGYYLMDKAYVRYSFPVKAGKTYFLMGNWTKLAPCGYSFKRNERDDNKWETFLNGRTVTVDGNSSESVTLPEEITAAVTDESSEDKVTSTACKITLKRNFTPNVWTSLVLPFSVSPTAVIDAFGEGTEIIHFDRVEGVTLHVTKHFHQMIVAGTPVMIKPAKTIDGTTENPYPVLVGTYEPKTVINEMEDAASGWKITGSYTPATVEAGAYMMGNKDGQSAMRHITSNMTVAGTRAWLVNTTDPQARLTSLCMNGVEDSEATFIEGISADTEKTNSRTNGIFNLNGQMVRSNAGSTAGLPAGIYIVNGRKVIVK